MASYVFTSVLSLATAMSPAGTGTRTRFDKAALVLVSALSLAALFTPAAAKVNVGTGFGYEIEGKYSSDNVTFVLQI